MSTLVEHSVKRNCVSPSRPRLLLIAYSFPPVGGAGVQRPVKWVKNLRRFGWDVTVLTTRNPSVPTRDESLMADIPDDVLVLRAKTWEPDYRYKQGLVSATQSESKSLVSTAKTIVRRAVTNIVKVALQPDPQVLWVPNAIVAGHRILREAPHSAILVTAPAYSSFFVGTYLKRRDGLPLVLDFRDEWDMSGRYLENAQRDGFSRFIQARMQNHVLKRADAVVATTVASTAKLTEKLVRLKRSATRTATVYNGFDEEEFRLGSTHNGISRACENGSAHSSAVHSNGNATPSSFRLLYTGTLWNLTTIEPLVQAIQKLNGSNPRMLSRLELVCVGRKTAEQSLILDKVRQTSCRLKLVDYCEHARVLEWLQSSDAVCLLLSDVPGAERVVPGKLFEYLANLKEMLAIVPRGETADIVRRFFPLGHFEPKDIDGIARWLESRLTGEIARNTPCSRQADINEFSRGAQTCRLVQLLDDLIRDHRPGGSDSR